MCGRYLFTLDQCVEMMQIVQEIAQKYGPQAWKPGEMRPTVKAPVLVSADGEIRSKLQKWGYQLPHSLVINARAESEAEKPLFRESIVSKRCVIPSTGFFEWDSQKRKYLFTLPGEDALYMAGLYMFRDGIPCYCILTTAANDSMREVHHRMPLVLLKEQVAPWLKQPEVTGDFLHMTPPPLAKASADAQMRLW